MVTESRKVRLIQLSSNDGRDVYDMLQRIGSNENRYNNPVHGKNFEFFKEWLLEMDAWSKGEHLPTGYVPQITFWLYDGQSVVGVGKLRTKLTPDSWKFGGNIGYAIDPSYRGRGYGTLLLKLLLEKAREMHIDELMETVEKFNWASRHVAEKNGAILLKENDERWYFVFK